MSKITVYGIKNCDTMKKAFGWTSTRSITSSTITRKKVPIWRRSKPLSRNSAGKMC